MSEKQIDWVEVDLPVDAKAQTQTSIATVKPDAI